MLLRAVFAISFAAICRVYAQEALTDALPAPTDATQQPIPESAWLDLRQSAPQNSKTQNAPAWVEGLALLPAETTEGAPMSKSVFRIRVTQPSPDYQVLFFRLFFDDKADQQPELIAWDESGLMIPYYVQGGDFAASFVLAHEFGHFAQSLWPHQGRVDGRGQGR